MHIRLKYLIREWTKQLLDCFMHHFARHACAAEQLSFCSKALRRSLRRLT